MNLYIKKLILEVFDFNGYLNRYLNNQGEDLPDEILKTNAPIIYAFTTPKVPDAIKIGYTDLGAWKRIEQWKRIYGDDINLLGYWTSKSLNQLLKYVFFKDHPVHKKVINRGHYNLMPEDFEKLKVLQNLLELHVSREFFRKINDKTHNDKDTLSKEIIAEIIRLMKQEIESGNANFTLYELLDDGTTRYADEIIQDIHQYDPTPLQQDCIDKGIKAIKEGKTDLLMAAVMRFGKTYTAYKIIAGLGDKEKMERLKYVVVVTAKADTRTAWRNDISHKDFIDKFVFIEFDGKTSYLVSEIKNEDGKIHTSSRQEPNLIERKLEENNKADGKTVIVFATLLDLKGNPTKLSKEPKKDIDFNGAVNTIKDKHKFLFNSHPDIMVIDETHYGTHSLTLGLITGFSEDNSDLKQQLKDAADMQLYVTSIDAKVKLQCSGTPYYILASGEFSKFYDNKEIISDVSYSDMLKARDEWVKDNPDKDETTSPYYGIPNIYKFGLKLTDSCMKILKENDWESKMSTLFALKNKGKNANPYDSEFVHEDAITDLMISLYGNKTNNQIGFINTDKIRDGEIFKHTMVLLPKINACFALEKLLNEKIIDKSKREVIRLVMPKSTGYKGDIKNSDTVNAKLNALEKAGKQSIILTVDRMLTGVTLPLVDSMIFMKDTKLPQDYDQAIFRMCSRNIGTAKDDEGNKVKINRKNNVYLIDFNIARMFKMTLDSAAAMAAAKGETGALAIEKYVLDNIDTIPTFTDDKDSIFDDETHRNNILSHIHSVNVHDLLKEYINYNKNRSIEDGIKDKSKNFKHFMSDSSTIDILRNFSDAKLGGNNGPALDPGTDDIPIDPKKGIGGKVKGKNSDNNKGNSTETETEDNKPELDKINERFGNMMKSILYSIICFDKPVKDMNDLLNTIKNDSACKQIMSDFKLSEELLKTIYDSMSNLEKNELDFMIYQIYLMMNDKSLKPIEQVTNCINKLGKIDSSEVVTPPELVDKMINKIDIEDFKKAKNILLVNEKCCEFFMGIYNNKQLGKEIALKCKIVPSSLMTVNFIKKILKQLKISESIILDIKDLNNDGKLIDDFLIMDNLKIGKFDICLMNPPYGTRGGDDIHFKFTEKCISLCDKTICVMPFALINGNTKINQKYKKILDPFIISAEEVDSKIFADTTQFNVGIYKFIKDKNIDDYINIDYINKSIKVKTLNIDIFNEYEHKFLDIISHNNMINMVHGVGEFSHFNSEYKKNGIIPTVKLRQNYQKKNCNKLIDNKIYLNVNIANGAKNAIFINNKTNGNIFLSKNDLIDYIINRNISSGYNILIFDNVNSAENCKISLQNPLLRFTLSKLQTGLNIPTSCFKYIPDIDWEDPRVTTDEGLLEVCGCPKDKAKEYAEYCRKYMEEFDKTKTKKK